MGYLAIKAKPFKSICYSAENAKETQEDVRFATYSFEIARLIKKLDAQEDTITTRYASATMAYDVFGNYIPEFIWAHHFYRADVIAAIKEQISEEKFVGKLADVAMDDDVKTQLAFQTQVASALKEIFGKENNA
jgi:hypothetical protein